MHRETDRDKQSDKQTDRQTDEEKENNTYLSVTDADATAIKETAQTKQIWLQYRHFWKEW